MKLRSFGGPNLAAKSRGPNLAGRILRAESRQTNLEIRTVLSVQKVKLRTSVQREVIRTNLERQIFNDPEGRKSGRFYGPETKLCQLCHVYLDGRERCHSKRKLDYCLKYQAVDLVLN